MELSDKVESLSVAIIGNRATAIAGTVLLYCAGKLLFDGSEMSAEEIKMCYWGLFDGAMYSAITKLGISTWRHYKRTLLEVKEKGSADVQFFKERMVRAEHCRTIGYCQIQGLYLGARQSRQLDNFYQAKRESSRLLIPNF
ncbi:MAG: hypothetical protein WCV90_01010 [Candidatus Woesearchaeota archaeon]|jgi:hypothetical protein